MDILQAYLPYLSNYLPPSLFTTAVKILTTAFGILKALQTSLSPLLTRLVTQPDIATVLVVVVALFVSFKILDMAFRAVIFWVTLVIRLAMWGGAVAIGLWVWNRGVDGFVSDVQELGAYWWGEYERFSGEAKGWQRHEEKKVRYQAGKGYNQQGKWW